MKTASHLRISIHLRFKFGITLVVLLAAVLLVAGESAPADVVDYREQIHPVLEQHCLHCHGEDEQASGLRVDQRSSMLRGGDSGLASIVPGEPEKSYLLDVVNHVDPDMAMPPDGDKLSENEIALLSQWIKSGATVPGQMQSVAETKSDHWSFQPIRRPEVPKVESPSEGNVSTADSAEFSDRPDAHPIDRFLLRALNDKGLAFSQPADLRSLIRRVSIVLTGLPPTQDQTAAFIKASRANPEQAYEELVDELLSSHHFGERWAQHWLDVIRWAETNGSESNAYRKNAWIYRDYVIRAFNDDKPYDEFLFDQIAGDTNGQGDATGYLVSGPHVPTATVGREPVARRQARADRVDEILQTVGATALGVTIGCARCHHHKFDPISIQDYYSMSAVFQDVEFGSREPKLADDHPRKVRGDELMDQIQVLRKQIQPTGPWLEDWSAYHEIHVPETKCSSVRIRFAKNFVRLDELEVFGSAEESPNFALASEGTEVQGAIEITKASMPLKNINDGKFGNQSWIAKVDNANTNKDKADKDKPNNAKPTKPWVQFDFAEPQSVSRLRLSTNRNDVIETDYLEGKGKMMFEVASVEFKTEDDQWTMVVEPKTLNKVDDEKDGRAELLKEISELIERRNEEGPRASFVGKFVDPVKTFVLGRGSPESPREEVFPAGLAELGSDLGVEADAAGPTRRAAFAKWTTGPDNPLTARVIANRLWHHVFGRGIVSTTSDFGVAGAKPTHPELLDWLAAELVEPTLTPEGQPWSMKRLIRMMVMSEAFRQSSLPKEGPLRIDSDAALLWRFAPQRMEAEVIRDSILQASGLLKPTIGGRSFRIHNVKKRYAQWEVTDNFGPQTWRRMIYQERMRRVNDQMFTAFDFPDCGQVQAKRRSSTTPLQALNLMNSNFVMDQAKHISDRAREDAGGSMEESIDRCFEFILGRLPATEERDACLELVKENGLTLVCRALINSNEFAFLP